MAQRLAQAAKEIEHLIVESDERVNDGGKLVNDAGVAMSEVVQQVRGVTKVGGRDHRVDRPAKHRYRAN